MTAKNTIQKQYQTITANITNFKARDTQREMVESIDDCFSQVNEARKDGHNICLIEAPTGTGKSFAYILAGIKNAKLGGKIFIISTATKTLQGQLYNKDLPQFIKHSGENLTYGLAKGRANYLCPYQLESSLAGGSSDLLSDADDTPAKLKKIAVEYAKRDWDGDLDNAPLFIENKLKPLITIDKHQCLGYQCPYNQKDDSSCAFYNNREHLKNCDVIVTNHSLLIADIDSGGGSILPAGPEGYYLCIDEAHNFPTYAISGFMGQFLLKHNIGLVNNVGKLIANPANNSYILDDITLCDNLALKALELEASLDKFYQLLKINTNLFDNGSLILNDYLNSAITQDLRDIFVEIAFGSIELITGINQLQDKLKEQLKIKTDYVIEANLLKLGFYLTNIENIAKTATYLINQDNSRLNANARWVEQQVKVTAGEEFNVVAGVTHVGNLLADKLWSRVYGACLTSATLALGEDFTYVKSQLGLNSLSRVKATKLATTFDYPLHSQLVIPQFRYSPEYTTRVQFQKELSLYLNQILNYSESYGTLVLFFNRQQLIDTVKGLSPKLQNKILLQTEFSSTHKLISEHKEIIDSASPSIIFGLNSFAEGIDLPAKYCMHVIVSKLPFETYKDPQNMVREYWVKAENGNYFMDVSVPETCIKLIQAVGRLIRSEEDYGQVTICDNRVVLKQYGSILLNALPKFNRNYNPEFMKEAFNKIDVALHP